LPEIRLSLRRDMSLGTHLEAIEKCLSETGIVINIPQITYTKTKNITLCNYA